ncbi:MAG: methyltransferase domain-containing protein [bacterium]
MTCERFKIGQFSEYQESHHTARYRYAQLFVAGKSVLDIACGTGYGCAMLKNAGAENVRGIDLSLEAIEYATKTYLAQGIEFTMGNAECLSDLKSESFDVVTSFETIEHLPNVGLYLSEIHRVLRPGGIYIVSTPDRRLASTMYPIRGKPNNEFHVREYTRTELISLLETKFKIKECLGQTYVAWPLVLWPIQVALKTTCYIFRSLGAYQVINNIYHNSRDVDVESSRDHKWAVASFWIFRAERN